MEIYEKIYSITNINLPLFKETSKIRSIELLGGHLCTLSFLNVIQLYHIFSIVNVVERTKLLLHHYQEYKQLLEIKWKDLSTSYKQYSEQDEGKLKEEVKHIHEHLQRLLGHKSDIEYVKKIKAKLASGRYPEGIAKTI